MKMYNKKIIIEVLEREIRAELEYLPNNNVEAKQLIEAYKDFNKSYFKGIDYIANNEMLKDLLKEMEEIK